VTELEPHVLDALRNMSPTEWDGLVAEVRPPDQLEEFRTHAAEFVHHPDQLDALCRFADLGNFTGSDGAIDPQLVRERLTALLGPAPRPTMVTETPNWGAKGAVGKDAAAKRFGK
jgi:hypothetical protein